MPSRSRSRSRRRSRSRSRRRDSRSRSRRRSRSRSRGRGGGSRGRGGSRGGGRGGGGSGTIVGIRSAGFGFIRPRDGGSDVYFHATSCRDIRFDELREGDEVEYEMGEDHRSGKERAIDVRLMN